MAKKIVVRIDDVGYTPVNDMGAFEVFEHGVGTAADVMLDTPGTIQALERLKSFPWISVGWHTHLWGTPILPMNDVPTLVDPATGHFRPDLNRAENFSAEELLSEMRAQLTLCVKHLGKAPDTAMNMEPPGTLFARVKRQVCAEFGVLTGFANYVHRDRTGDTTIEAAEEIWRHRNIYWLDPGSAYGDLFTDSVEAMGAYDPVKFYTEDRGGMGSLPDKAVCGQAWHPGYVDYYMCRCGDRSPNARKFIECRPLDVHALCSEEMKNWIRQNSIELVSFTDAIYGRQDYQNHLRAIGSDLCIL